MRHSRLRSKLYRELHNARVVALATHWQTKSFNNNYSAEPRYILLEGARLLISFLLRNPHLQTSQHQTVNVDYENALISMWHALQIRPRCGLLHVRRLRRLMPTIMGDEQGASQHSQKSAPNLPDFAIASFAFRLQIWHAQTRLASSRNTSPIYPPIRVPTPHAHKT